MIKMLDLVLGKMKKLDENPFVMKWFVQFIFSFFLLSHTKTNEL